MSWYDKILREYDELKRGAITIKDLAKKNQVSERTVQRDIKLARAIKSYPSLKHLPSARKALAAVKSGRYYSLPLIRVSEIEHAAQRYSTAGDWQFKRKGKAKCLRICISRTSKPEHAYLLAIHELIEAVLCKFSYPPNRRVSEKDVDEWDIKHSQALEPGALLGCPYRDYHLMAETIERFLAEKLGIDWKSYERELYDLKR